MIYMIYIMNKISLHDINSFSIAPINNKNTKKTIFYIQNQYFKINILLKILINTIILSLFYK